jgi:cytoskeleton protein RodZ
MPGNANNPPNSSADEHAVVDDVITIEVKADCWIDIVDRNGRRLAKELLKGGTTAIYRGTSPFQVRLGNSHAVDIVLNGKAFDLTPYRRTVVSRFTLEAGR